MLVTTQTENPFRDCSVRAKEKVSTGKMASTLKGKQKYLNKELQAQILLKNCKSLFLFIDFMKQVFSLFAAAIVFNWQIKGVC